MSEQENFDIGRIVGLIMENPQLIEQISNLAHQKSDTPHTENKAEPQMEHISSEEKSAQASVPPTYLANDPTRGNRTQLLGALKPYVSEQRAKAIDSMISIADIIDMMRSR